MAKMSEKDRRAYNRDCKALEAAHQKVQAAQREYDELDRKFDETWNLGTTVSRKPAPQKFGGIRNEI